MGGALVRASLLCAACAVCAALNVPTPPPQDPARELYQMARQAESAVLDGAIHALQVSQKFLRHERSRRRLTSLDHVSSQPLPPNLLAAPTTAAPAPAAAAGARGERREPRRRRRRKQALPAGAPTPDVPVTGGDSAADAVSELASRLPEWQALRKHLRTVRRTHLRDLLSDEERTEETRLEHDGLVFDFSRQRVTSKTVDLLLDLARATRVDEKIRCMAEGDLINTSEERRVLHMALRTPRSATPQIIDNQDVVSLVHEARDRVSLFAQRVRSGQLRGATGKPFRSFVVVGIGVVVAT